MVQRVWEIKSIKGKLRDTKSYFSKNNGFEVFWTTKSGMDVKT